MYKFNFLFQNFMNAKPLVSYRKLNVYLSIIGYGLFLKALASVPVYKPSIIVSDAIRRKT